MKTKFLFASLVASAVMVGCSNEELADVQNAASNDNLALIFDGFEGVESRMAYDGSNGSFLWEVGDQIGVSRVSGKGVTTNYLFDATKVSNDNTKPITDAAWDDTASPAAKGKYAYFTTAFGSIFKGDYVVYYPYNPDFCEDGKIVAKLNYGQTEVAGSQTLHVAEDGFMMSKAVAFEGGQKAEKFALYPVFGRLVFKIKTPIAAEIETIVLRSLNGKTLPTEMEIDADINVVDGKLNSEYMHVVESSKVEEIVMCVDGTATSSPSTVYEGYFTVIPGTYTDFAIDVITSQGTFSREFSSASISTGSRANVELKLTEDDAVLTRSYYATSKESWQTAIAKIATSVTNAEMKGATIKVMNKIELTGNEFRPTQNLSKHIPVVVEGPGSIKVTAKSTTGKAFTDITFNVPVEVSEFAAVDDENVHFAAGLKATTSLTTSKNANYTIDGGTIKTLTVGNAKQILTVNNVTFKDVVNVTIANSSYVTGTTTAVNFNDCTFEKGLTNSKGMIRINNATMVEPDADNAIYSTLNVTGGEVLVNGDLEVEKVTINGTTANLDLQNASTTTINLSLTTTEGLIKVNKDATLTLSPYINYELCNKIAVEGKLVNNGTLTARGEDPVVTDIEDNNHEGVIENNGIVRVEAASFGSAIDKAKWYNNQKITFENKADHNIIVKDMTGFHANVVKEGITGIEYECGKVETIDLIGKGTGAAFVSNHKDFSDINLILSGSKTLTVKINNGLKFKNIEVVNNVNFVGVTKNATVTTGDLTIYAGKLTIDNDGNDAAKASVTNVAVAKFAELANGAQVTYTGTFTNNGTVSGGNPVK